MKKILFALALLLVCIPMMVNAKEKDKKVTMYVFYGKECPHCHEFFEFLDSIDKEYGKYYNIEKIETWHEPDNKKLLINIEKNIEIDISDDDLGAVPYIVIGDNSFIGYSKLWNQDIKDAIVEAYEDDNYQDRVGKYLEQHKKDKRNENILYYTSIFGLVFLTCIAVFVKEKRDLKKSA